MNKCNPFFPVRGKYSNTQYAKHKHQGLQAQLGVWKPQKYFPVLICGYLTHIAGKTAEIISFFELYCRAFIALKYYSISNNLFCALIALQCSESLQFNRKNLYLITSWNDAFFLKYLHRDYRRDINVADKEILVVYWRRRTRSGLLFLWDKISNLCHHLYYCLQLTQNTWACPTYQYSCTDYLVILFRIQYLRWNYFLPLAGWC